MHSNGEKTNPGPIGKQLNNIQTSNMILSSICAIESMIVRHPAVGRAMMFGREQFHPGIIIEPVEGLRVDDEKSQNAFIDEIW